MALFGFRVALRIIGMGLAAVAISQIARGMCHSRTTLKENERPTKAKRNRPGASLR